MRLGRAGHQRHRLFPIDTRPFMELHVQDRCAAVNVKTAVHWRSSGHPGCSPACVQPLIDARGVGRPEKSTVPHIANRVNIVLWPDTCQHWLPQRCEPFNCRFQGESRPKERQRACLIPRPRAIRALCAMQGRRTGASGADRRGPAHRLLPSRPRRGASLAAWAACL